MRPVLTSSSRAKVTGTCRAAHLGLPATFAVTGLPLLLLAPAGVSVTFLKYRGHGRKEWCRLAAALHSCAAYHSNTYPKHKHKTLLVSKNKIT